MRVEFIEQAQGEGTIHDVHEHVINVREDFKKNQWLYIYQQPFKLKIFRDDKITNNQDTSNTEIKNSKSEIVKIGRRNLGIMIILGLTGQIAWAVENTWFNTFVFDMLTPDPRPIAWMVAVSAVVATITTLIIGSLSDRTHTKMGRRKPYILFGYILWGIITAIFPLVALIQVIGIAVVMVVIMDAIMTFFGSTANDAAYNAWITDIGHPTNRNKINSINTAAALLANLIALGVAGVIIDTYGYFIFFYILGGIVSVSGLIAGVMIKEPQILESTQASSKSLLTELKELVSIQDLKENKILYLLFLNMAIGGIASNVYFPYLFIYLEHYLGFSKTIISLIALFLIGCSTILVLILGFLIKKTNRKLLLMLYIIIGTLTLLIFAFVKNIWLVTIIYMLSLTFSQLSGVVRNSWMQDKYPQGDIGKFQGVRLIFMVGIPMVIGPFIGSFVIQLYGIPIIVEGESGFIPTPPVIIFSALLTLLALIPLFFIKKSEGEIL
ncbi:MAG: MFS transporter [Promethearchaeota archaeon]